MLRVDCGRWGQTPDDLRRLALNDCVRQVLQSGAAQQAG
jgi:hypothetical protein